MTKRPLKPRIKVNEGDVYAVPIEGGGYGVGLVARKGKGGVLFGYFFGTRYTQPPSIDEAQTLRPESAVLVKVFGDLGIQLQEWPFIGRLEGWNRGEWPMPEFGSVDTISDLAWINRYSEDDPSVLVARRRCSVEEARRLPQDATSGYKALEFLLSQKLSATAL